MRERLREGAADTEPENRNRGQNQMFHWYPPLRCLSAKLTGEPNSHRTVFGHPASLAVMICVLK